ncbi:hypothetical protein BpHYR1_031301 [Brachionus plicatilis]|uniref:Uncharacterized protein n=1 Tax=Brachionus plicatilis TaxID=10195 RepID=A0A3M7T7G1_BRAPC|nr:hypothetical protein BpHYR1_031301 [Brachionus plicatilis]
MVDVRFAEFLCFSCRGVRGEVAFLGAIMTNRPEAPLNCSPLVGGGTGPCRDWSRCPSRPAIERACFCSCCSGCDAKWKEQWAAGVVEEAACLATLDLPSDSARSESCGGS